MLIKAERLKPDDTVAAILLSYVLAALVPHRYQVGKRQVEETFGVKCGLDPELVTLYGFRSQKP
jgi:hypothetical protein